MIDRGLSSTPVIAEIRIMLEYIDSVPYAGVTYI